ncbi:MAG: hypothetical protein JRJ85_06755 [Deltaproteobacteria bacterium]|nr:hypothetical protein [Deltaproteobacteria bacterium]
MPFQEISLNSPIEEKIAWTDDCYHRFQNTWIENQKIRELLLKLEDAIRSSHEKMMEIGIGEECGKCEHKEGGSCCGRGLENKYSGSLLLINLLLGQHLPKKRQEEDGCFFLGKNGCFLSARHTICINYLCRKITDKIDPQKIAALREKEGIELQYLFLLNEIIKQTLKMQDI